MLASEIPQNNKPTNKKDINIKKLKIGIVIGTEYHVLMNPIDIKLQIEMNSLLEANPFKLIEVIDVEVLNPILFQFNKKFKEYF